MEVWLNSFYAMHSGQMVFILTILLLAVCGLGIPIPEEIPLFIVGYLVYQEDITLIQGSIWTLLAIFVGDSTLFYVGYRFGQNIFKIPWFRRLASPKRLNKVNDYLHRYGSRVVFVGRFLAGLRGPIFLMTGVLKMNYRKFIFFDGIAALISVPTSIYISYLLCDKFGGHISSARTEMKMYETFFVQLLFAALALIFLIIFWKVHRRQRSTKAIHVLEASEEK